VTSAGALVRLGAELLVCPTSAAAWEGKGLAWNHVADTRSRFRQILDWRWSSRSEPVLVTRAAVAGT